MNIPEVGKVYSVLLSVKTDGSSKSRRCRIKIGACLIPARLFAVVEEGKTHPSSLYLRESTDPRIPSTWYFLDGRRITLQDPLMRHVSAIEDVPWDPGYRERLGETTSDTPTPSTEDHVEPELAPEESRALKINRAILAGKISQGKKAGLEHGFKLQLCSSKKTKVEPGDVVCFELNHETVITNAQTHREFLWSVAAYGENVHVERSTGAGIFLRGNHFPLPKHFFRKVVEDTVAT